LDGTEGRKKVFVEPQPRELKGSCGSFVTVNLSLLYRLRHPGREEVLIWAIANLALFAALAYTRYRMYKLWRKQ
jgi:hypothetical protein